jgi:hypothetical protein
MKGLKHPPFAKPAPPVQPRREEIVEVLPSIDEFLDDLPSIDDFLDVDAPREIQPQPDYPLVAESATWRTQSEEGWAAGDWQSYDWGSLSALNRAIPHGAGSDETWGESDWPEPYPVAPRSSADRGGAPTADEVADALDGIAHRIRSGELVIDDLHGTRPEAAMAAALAVLLRMRG